MDIVDKCDETVKSEFDRRWSGPKWGQSVVFWTDDGSLSSVMETLTSIKENSIGVPETVLSCASGFADILLRVTKRRDEGIESLLVNTLVAKTFGSDILRQYIKKVSNCYYISCCNTREPMIDDGCPRVRARYGMGRRRSLTNSM